VKIQRKYIIAVYFGLLMGATAYGAGTVSDADADADGRVVTVADLIQNINEKEYKATKFHIDILPEGTDLNAPGTLGQYPKDRPSLPEDRPPLHGCVWFNFPSVGILKALLERPSVDVDLLHEGVTPLWTVLGAGTCDDFPHRLKIAKLLIDSRASLLKPCSVKTWSQGGFDRFGYLWGDKESYFNSYRFGKDTGSMSTPLELGLQRFMNLTDTFIGSWSYLCPVESVGESEGLLRKILRGGLELATLERTPDGSGFQEYTKGLWYRDAPKESTSNWGYTEICYKVIQPGAPAFAVTKRVYNMIMDVRA
jgi:hypothetical protein